MDPLYEQRLREEVIFLHSLWYQGPPRPTAAVSANHHSLLYQNPPIPAVSASRYHLHPPKPTNFKKGKKRKGKIRKIFQNNATADPSSSHGAEWPCAATPPPATSWPAAGRQTPDVRPLTAEEQSKLASKKAHQRALKGVREFVSSDNADGFDEIDSSDDEMTEENRGRDELDFFFKLFEDSGLRECYEKNFVEGEFSCLVCGVVGGKKTAKKFKGCLSLVQHSITVGKTKRRRAHKALAQAVCKVLGWEINRLPEIVSMLMTVKLANTQGNTNGDSVKDDRIDDGAAPASDAMNFSACPDADKTGNEDPFAVSAIASSSASVPIIVHHLQPSEATQFNEKQHQCESKEKLDNYAATESNSSQGAGWSCPSPPHLPSATGWATLEKSSLKSTLLSTEEQLILAGRHAHQHALKAVHEFFCTNNSNDFDEINSSSDDDDGEEAELMEEDGGSEYGFFFKVFEEDSKLREYYTNNFAEGVFSCLVCGAMGGKKMGKKFKGCLPLVQHSSTIAQTKKRKAHRAFGQAVCKVLGWDIDRLPAVESMLSDKTENTQISLTVSDGDKDMENPGMVHQKSMEEPASQELTIAPLEEQQSHGE